ncbi:MAG: phosphotransferase [Candidatus Hodarchaeales archaeon]|jgi:hypothetical protein
MSSESVEKVIILNKKTVQIIKHPKITDEQLRRHYGLDSNSLTDLDLFEYINQLNRVNAINITILIGKNKVKAIFLLLSQLSDIQFTFPPIEFDLINPHNLQLLFQYNDIFPNDILPVFFEGNELPNSDLTTVTTDSIESTNFHYILHFKTGEQIRFKKYTRYTIAQTREAILARILSEKGFYPKFYSILGIKWEKLALEIKQPYYYSPLGLFIENIQNPESIEEILSSLYLAALRNPNQRSIGTIKSYQRELQNVIDFLEQFENTLKSISRNEDLYNILGQPETGFKLWKNSFSKKLEKIENRLKLPSLNIDEITEDYQIIHGDCWLRQFVKSEGKVLLLDLEDIGYGHRLFDLASLVNSLEQQNDYFRVVIAKENDEINWIQDLKFSFMNFILEKIPQDMLRTFVILRIMRMIHELEYILQYQPYLTWQIEIMVKRTKSLTEKLQKEKFEYIELLNIE